MMLRIWSELIDQYSALELTYAKDRLPAIEGVASGLLWVSIKRSMMLIKEKCAPSWSWANTVNAVRSGCSSFNPTVTKSRITLNGVLDSPNEPQILMIMGQIQCCSVSVEPEPKPAKGRRDKTPEEEDDINDYSFRPNYPDESDDPYGRTHNICRFDRERGTQTEFFFLLLECSEHLQMLHCRGLLLNCEKDNFAGQTSYARAGIGWASHPVWHKARTSLVRLE